MRGTPRKGKRTVIFDTGSCVLCDRLNALQAVFHTAILNDTLFLHNIKIVDYSIVVGLDQDKRELVSFISGGIRREEDFYPSRRETAMTRIVAKMCSGNGLVVS